MPRIIDEYFCRDGRVREGVVLQKFGNYKKLGRCTNE